jgi:Na+(H+)/acetate symporter ActP
MNGMKEAMFSKATGLLLVISSVISLDLLKKALMRQITDKQKRASASTETLVSAFTASALHTALNMIEDIRIPASRDIEI